MLVLQVVNAIASLSTVIAACLALARPNMFSGSRHTVEGERFFANMYAARAIPFGVLAGVLPFIAFADRWPTKALLIAAALVRVADVLIGAGKKEWGMVGGAAAAVVVHGLTAWLICSRRTGPAPSPHSPAPLRLVRQEDGMRHRSLSRHCLPMS